MNMNKKIKEVLLYGGLGWGLPFFVFFSILRWIEYKSPAFGSLTVFLVISIIAGCVFGLITQILSKKREAIKFNIKNFFYSILFFAIVFLIYGIIFRYILISNDWDQPFIGTSILLILVILSLLIQNRMIVKKASI
ncbi:hypothetical protein [Acinetobacter faecalis]|uniref:hypothetical protein n=1 Tax=Acinetobacter faecalis TaxID=2665161 RepID=UPI002A9168E9|nr:hypothetical protein [Acinetobacter faecalis]MDY6456000.1 hypothetical protein [Acinetobacter faecalis]MDY6459555.1 hypothetical protein [Acinetobacter faecalis]MDY6468593.1 hypothetical protein [Acinetobacter faecalis]